jgi:signal transduction histidine kinase
MGRELVANASHELRTPLAVIASTADTLLDTTGGDSRQRDFLEIITRHAARLQRLVDETLQLSCLQGGIEGRPRELVGLAELVEEALTFHATAAAKKRQQLLVRVSPDLAPVRGVPALLVQAIRNLVDNAIRYAPPGGSVEVRAEAAGTGHVGLLVVDNGPGIAPAEQSRVFDRFYRGATAGEAGTGLGLAIVARVAELHGGRVELESTPGRGCSFRLLLPEAGAGSDAAGPSR